MYNYKIMEYVGGGVDYNSGPYTVQFNIGVTSVTFNVSIIDDSIFEGNDSFYLDINLPSLPRNIIIGDYGQTFVTIIDDDGKL